MAHNGITPLVCAVASAPAHRDTHAQPLAFDQSTQCMLETWGDTLACKPRCFPRRCPDFMIRHFVDDRPMDDSNPVDDAPEQENPSEVLMAVTCPPFLEPCQAALVSYTVSTPLPDLDNQADTGEFISNIFEKLPSVIHLIITPNQLLKFQTYILAMIEQLNHLDTGQSNTTVPNDMFTAT